VILHLIVGTALASFFLQTVFVTPKETRVEFDLVADTIEIPDRIDNPILNSSGFSDNDPEAAGQMVGSVKTPLKRRAVVMASLASLSELSYTFGFVNQEAESDSIGGSFLPVLGNAPNSDYNSFGLKKGEGFGRRGGILISGGGVCIAPPGR
jgi:hypothetical protein